MCAELSPESKVLSDFTTRAPLPRKLIAGTLTDFKDELADQFAS